MVRLHLHSVLLAALAVTQVAIPFVASAPASGSRLESGQYQLSTDKDFGLTVVTEDGSQKLRSVAHGGDKWEVIRTVSGAYTFRWLGVSSTAAYICLPSSPSELDEVGICSDPDSGAKILLVNFSPKITYHMLAKVPGGLTVQIDAKGKVVLRKIAEYRDNPSGNEEWIFLWSQAAA